MRTRVQFAVGWLYVMALGACSLSAPSDTLLMGENDVCPIGTKGCDGVCVSRSSPSVGCGAESCQPCEVPNATADCTAGACSVGTCQQGWADCDGDPSTGCESKVPQGTKPCDCNALELATDTARIDIQQPGELGVGDGSWTLEAWLQREPEQATGDRKKHIFQMETAGEPDPTSSLKLAFTETYEVECTAGTRAELGRNLVSTEHAVSPGEWHHVVCMRRENLLMVYVDGAEEGRAQCDATIEAPDTASIGWQAGQPTRPEKLRLGPFRFSSTSRYEGPFEPRAHWVVDDHTIVQYLVTGKLEGSLLSDDAGDNIGTALGCTALETSPCSD